ncbi:MAG: hypothetical protein ACTH23_02065 [Moraxellaceae bacterium]|nr:hypothetical protein [Psychrobacter sp.]
MNDLVFIDNSFSSHFRVKFTINEPAPVATVIESLKGFEKLIKRTQPLVEKTLQDIKIIRTEVYIDEIIEGSLIYDFVVKHVISEENIEKAKKLGHDIVGDKPVVKTVVSMGVGALIYAATTGYIDSTNVEQTRPPEIEAYNSVILNAAGDVNISSEDISEFIDKASHDKAVTRDVVSATSPIKLDDKVELVMEDFPLLTVSHSVLKELPENTDHLTPTQRAESYPDIDVYIYASDQDKGNNGWAGIVPDLFEKRVKFKLADSVSPISLHGRKKVKADIVVHQSFNRTTLEYDVDYVAIEAVN